MVNKEELEVGLRWALGTSTGTAKKAASNVVKLQRIKVTLYVRHDWGGHPLLFEHTVTTVSPLFAEVETAKAARRAGYKVCWRVDTEVVPDGA